LRDFYGIGGALLFALATYAVISAGWSFWTQRAEEFSIPGLLVALVAIPIMNFLAKRKIAIAEQVGSRALRASMSVFVARLASICPMYARLGLVTEGSPVARTLLSLSSLRRSHLVLDVVYMLRCICIERLIPMHCDIYLSNHQGGRKISRDQPHARRDNNLSEKPIKIDSDLNRNASSPNTTTEKLRRRLQCLFRLRQPFDHLKQGIREINHVDDLSRILALHFLDGLPHLKRSSPGDHNERCSSVLSAC
jgi:hypothetical protein